MFFCIQSTVPWIPLSLSFDVMNIHTNTSIIDIFDIIIIFQFSFFKDKQCLDHDILMLLMRIFSKMVINIVITRPFFFRGELHKLGICIAKSHYFLMIHHLRLLIILYFSSLYTKLVYAQLTGAPLIFYEAEIPSYLVVNCPLI